MILDKINKILDKVEAINYEESPDNCSIVEIPEDVWNLHKESIVREVLKRPDIKIQVNGGFGGGRESSNHVIELTKYKNLSPIIDKEEQDRNIKEILRLK